MDLEFVIKAKYDELVQAQARLEELNKQYESLQREFQSGHISTQSFSDFQKTLVSTFNEIGDASDKVSQKFISLGNSIGQGGLDTAAFERMSIVLRQVMEDGTGSADAIQKITLAAQGFSAIEEQIRNQKAEVQDLSNTYNEQKAVIEDMKATMDEYKISLEQANQAGDKSGASELKEQITTLKSDLMVAKTELDGFAEAGAQAREKLSGLEQLMGTLGKAIPNFADMTAGAETAQQKIDILNNSFNAFQSASDATSESIRKMSDESAQYSITAEQLAAAVAAMTRDMNNATGLESADQMSARFQDITQKVEEYGTAIANQTATAEMAFNQQKQYIQSLEEEMSRLQTLMSEAMSQGDVSSAGALAQQMQTLANAINEAKNQLVQLQQEAEKAKVSLSNVGKEQADMLKAASRGDTFFGKIFDTYDKLKEKAGEAFDKIKDKAAEATSGIRGKFSNAADSISDKFNGLVDKIGFDRLQERIAPLGDKISSVFGKSKESVDSFIGAIDGMGIPLGNTIQGIKGMTMATLKFIATPLGMVLGAIALALKSVWTYLNKSAEGQKIMAKGSAMLGSIMGSITDLLVLFGKTLFKIFSSGDPIIRDFCNTLVSTFKSAFKAVRDILGGIGTMLQGAFTLDWDKVKEGFEQSGKGLEEAGETMVGIIKTQVKGAVAAFQVLKEVFTDKELSSGITNILDNMWSKAVRAGQMSGEEMQNKVDKSNASANFQGQQQRINEERNKIYSLEGKERLKQIELVKKMQKEAYEPIIATQQKELALIKEKNAMHNSTLSDLAKERELNLEVAKSKARQAASTRMMARLEASTQKSIDKKAKQEEKKAASDAKKAASAAKKETSKSNAVTQAESKEAQVVLANVNAQAKEIADIQSKIENARIAAMEDGYQRTKAEKQKQYDDELYQIEVQKQKAVDAEIKRQKAEFDAAQAVIKAKGGKVEAWDDKMVSQKNLDEIKKYYDELEKYTRLKQHRESVDSLASEYDKNESERKAKINKLRIDIAELEEALQKATSLEEVRQIRSMKRMAKAQLDWLEGNKDAWNEYYTKYGTFLEKKKALDDKFAHDTIGLDENNPTYLMFKKQKEAVDSALEAESKLKELDWTNAFGNLAKLSQDTLQNIKQQLLDIIEADEKLNATDKAKFVEKYNQVNEQIQKNKLSFVSGNWIGSIAENAMNKKELKKDYEAKKKAYEEAQKDYDKKQSASLNAQSKASQSQMNLDSFLQKKGSKLGAKDLKGLNTKQAMQALKDSGVDTSQFGEGFQSLFNGFSAASQGADVAASQASEAAQAMSQAGSALQGAEGAMGGGGGGGGAAMAETIIKGVNQNVQSLNELVKEWGDEDSDFAKGMNDFAESSDQAVQAFDSLKSGDLMGVILHLSKAVESLGKSFAHFFGFDGGEREYKRELEHYQKLSKIWDELIDKKTEYLNLSYGSNAIKEQKEIESIYKAELTSLEKLGKAYLSKHSVNAHSAGYRQNKEIGSAGFSKWSDIAGERITSVEDLFTKDLSYDTLVKLMTADDGEIWAKLDEETQDYLNKIMSAKKGIEELGDSLKERLTGVSFDEFKDNFISAMKDMNSSATDMTNNFKQNLRDAILDTMIDKKFKTRLQKLYDDFAEANEDGEISKEEYDRLVEEEGQIASDMQAAKRQLIEQYGWTTDETTSGTSKGFSSMTQDQASELNGRFTAMNESMSMMNGTLANIHANVLASLDLQNTSILELTAINRNTAMTNEHLAGLSDEMVRIRKKLEYL